MIRPHLQRRRSPPEANGAAQIGAREIARMFAPPQWLAWFLVGPGLVQPIAFGATLNLNPLAVLVLTIAAGCLFGMVGLVLAAPIASAVAPHISRDLTLARAAATGEASAEAPPVPAPAGG